VAVDARGNVYVANGQIFVYAYDGRQIAEIDVPERPLQLIFGGPGHRMLFILAHHALFAAQVTGPVFPPQSQMTLPRKLYPDRGIKAYDKGAVLSKGRQTGSLRGSRQHCLLAEAHYHHYILSAGCSTLQVAVILLGHTILVQKGVS
jgi:SMP-30/Gluconolactonase/LRE-like region